MRSCALTLAFLQTIQMMPSLCKVCLQLQRRQSFLPEGNSPYHQNLYHQIFNHLKFSPPKLVYLQILYQILYHKNLYTTRFCTTGTCTTRSCTTRFCVCAGHPRRLKAAVRPGGPDAGAAALRGGMARLRLQEQQGPALAGTLCDGHERVQTGERPLLGFRA